jgi:hypothetical protein
VQQAAGCCAHRKTHTGQKEQRTASANMKLEVTSLCDKARKAQAKRVELEKSARKLEHSTSDVRRAADKGRVCFQKLLDSSLYKK